MKVAFIGLGNMGKEMAPHILQAGHELTVYNRTRSATDGLQQLGARVADSPADAVHEAEVLLTIVADDAAVKDVIFGTTELPGAIEQLAKDAIHVSMSTISVALSQQLESAHKAAGQAYLSAPVLGRPVTARAAKLWVLSAGESKLIERCRPLFEAMGQGVFVVGDQPHLANLVKVTGNFTIASVLETLSEAFVLMQKSGISPLKFLEIINTAVFNSPVYDVLGKMIAEEQYEPAEFKLRLGLKDVRLVLEAAESAAVPLPLASLVRDHFLSGMARGDGEIDWSAIGRVNASNAGL
ncbi:2-hydroxy-3-oxopropionate reductase (plasmid) [Crinalium epipsammum PCC 9333]|uniref:2-hydroxy-3-oxopropionate reductase n=1 Tax=Crinalium epipsammum PCC 9333 TaxID=1173022 RepID=K9W588_9CYAN|nr:NAD(P)-dependent oxidoreductase [Crinalium epipsammum]AFZ15513.1 2-hydroxy-3-oxopropionate reductase [Crinalium epipsammum PCC 9333]